MLDGMNQQESIDQCMCFLEQTQVLFSLMFNLSTGTKHKAVGPDQPPAYILPQYFVKSS